MSDIAIKIENLSKQYRLGTIGTGTLSHDLKRWWTMNIRGKEDPFLRIGETNQRDIKGNSEYVWALRDINLDIAQGDVVGIIGKNGAGKSTLLKILSRVTRPTTGSISYKGRIASLLEVGTGFHSEMTGRENIYMNGAIMGMTRSEITRKLDEIVDFAGIERYIDTPVKRYSSGMTVRLGFSIAAHLEPEILVVDEVLAVGDAEFQKKAIGKMKDVSKGTGRTVLFVSHNMAAVKSLCKTGILLKDGCINEIGEIDYCVGKYLKGDNQIGNYKCYEKPIVLQPDFDLLEIGIKANGKGFSDTIRIDEEIVFIAKYKQKVEGKTLDITLHIKDDQGVKLFSTGSGAHSGTLIKQTGIVEVTTIIPSNFFNWGNFYVDLYVVENLKRAIYIETDILSFTLVIKEVPMGIYMGKEPGGVKPIFNWEKNIVNL
ncbi:MAG: ABC transporter ATP-binding protein [Salinivirgaceae bacterium]|nr:ABC transporter ATP-binding protein [Salinivirgaceae bacterium]